MVRVQRSFIRAYGVRLLLSRHPEVRKLKRFNTPSAHGNKLWKSSWLLMDYFNRRGLSEGSRVLEVGCGWGLAGIYCAKRHGANVTGVDIDPECIAICKKHVPEGCFYVHNVERMPMFINKQFDVVSAICLLEHVDNPTAMVREALRVCKINGLGIFVTPNIGRWHRFALAGQKKEKWERSGHKQGWDYHLLKHFLENQGWKVEKIVTRFVDCPFYAYLPRPLGDYLSHKLLPRLFPNVGSELYAFCRRPK